MRIACEEGYIDIPLGIEPPAPLTWLDEDFGEARIVDCVLRQSHRDVAGHHADAQDDRRYKVAKRVTHAKFEA